MKKRKNKSTKLAEFLTLFVMVIGTTVGGGIYLKNKEVLEQTGNPIIGIILWAIVGAVCVMSIIVFMEISSSTKTHGNGTIGNWTKVFINRKTASFFSLIYLFVYAPSIYALFAGTFVNSFLLLINQRISAGGQLTIYLVFGIVMIVAFSLLNGLKPKWSKGIQIFGTVFKFIPLLVAFIAGFVLIKTHGNGIDSSAMWNGGYGSGQYDHWSTSNWDGKSFIRGFGGILLAFDGYIYLANAQKDAKNKEVVPIALLSGLIFVAIFYVLMAVSLFLGSPDGSIISLFGKLFGGQAGYYISNAIMLMICFINMNIMALVGTLQVESDTDAKLLYTGANRNKVSKFKSAMMAMFVTIIVYVAFILIGTFVKTNGNSGWSNTNIEDGYTLTFIGIMSSVGAILSFSMVAVVTFGAFANRFTHKVLVDKKRGVPTLAIISGVLMVAFVVLGLYTFLDPNKGDYSKTSWASTSALPFLILFVVMMAITVIAFFVQEALFKKYPFKNGFAGELEDDDPRPFIFKFSPIQNYYTKKGVQEMDEIGQQDNWSKLVQDYKQIEKDKVNKG